MSESFATDWFQLDQIFSGLPPSVQVQLWPTCLLIQVFNPHQIPRVQFSCELITKKWWRTIPSNRL